MEPLLTRQIRKHLTGLELRFSSSTLTRTHSPILCSRLVMPATRTTFFVFLPSSLAVCTNVLSFSSLERDCCSGDGLSVTLRGLKSTASGSLASRRHTCVLWLLSRSSFPMFRWPFNGIGADRFGSLEYSGRSPSFFPRADLGRARSSDSRLLWAFCRASSASGKELSMPPTLCRFVFAAFLGSPHSLALVLSVSRACRLGSRYVPAFRMIFLSLFSPTLSSSSSSSSRPQSRLARKGGLP